MSNHNDVNDTQPVEDALHELFQTAEPKETFVKALEHRLLAKPRAKPRSTWNERLEGLFVFTRPAVAWGALALLLVAGLTYGIARILPTPLARVPADPTTVALTAPTATLRIPATTAPRPTPAQNVAYLPEADFVNIDEVRILNVQVAQHHQEKGVLLSQAVGWDDRTEVWIERQGDWHNLEGAWLELTDGRRLEMRYWTDAANPHQASKSYMQFPAMPEESSQAVLALPDGWRLPFSLIPPVEAAEQNIAVVETEVQPCVQTADIRLCVLGAVQDLNGAHVLVGAESGQPGMPVFIPVETDPPLLDIGNDIPLKAVFDLYAEPYGSPQPAEQVQYTFDFRPYENGSRLATLSIPAVRMRAPVNQVITVDLAGDLKAGQSWAVEFPVQVADQTLMIRKAHVVKSITGGLQLWLYTDPVTPVNGRSVISLELGSTSPELDTYGYGYNQFSRQHEFVFELTHANGEAVTEQLTFSITSADLLLSGPFTFQVDLVAGQLLASVPTEVVEVNGFTPPPTPTPLPMTKFTYYDRPLGSGEALFIEIVDNISYLYAMAMEPAQPAELVASFPGKIYEVMVMPGGSEIVYVAGDANEEGFIHQARFYRWNVSHTAPRPILDPLTYVTSIEWSQDGQYAYYETVENTAGAPTRRWVFDLASTAPTLIPMPQGVHIFGAIWSPVGHKLALSGYDENTSGQNDLYLLNLDSDAEQLSLVNLTQTPNTTEQAAAWIPNSESMLYQAEVDLNVYGLFSASLINGKSAYLGLLPFYTYSPVLTSDGKLLALAGHHPEEGVGLYGLDMETGGLTHFASGANFASLSFSPDNLWLSYASGDATVQTVEIFSGNVWILRSLSSDALARGNRITWTGWTP